MAEWTDAEIATTLHPDVEASRQLDADALFSRVSAETVDEGPSVRRRLQTLSTPMRRLLGVAVVFAVSAVVLGAQGLRTDLDTMGWFRLGGMMIGLLAMSAGCVGLTLRPLHRPHQRVLDFGAGIWVIAGLIAMLPTWPGMAQTPDPAWSFHVYCLSVTTAATLAITSPLLVLDRGRRPAPWRKALAAGAGGVAMLGVQSLFCPIVHAPHMLLGHGSAAIWVGALAIGIGWVRTRLR